METYEDIDTREKETDLKEPGGLLYIKEKKKGPQVNRYSPDGTFIYVAGRPNKRLVDNGGYGCLI